MNCKRYTTETKVFSSNGQTDSNCNGLTFVNTGSVSVTVDNLLLQPGQQLTITGNENEVCVKIFYFTFPAGLNPSLTVIFKRYI